MFARLHYYDQSSLSLLPRLTDRAFGEHETKMGLLLFPNLVFERAHSREICFQSRTLEPDHLASGSGKGTRGREEERPQDLTLEFKIVEIHQIRKKRKENELTQFNPCGRNQGVEARGY